MIALQAADRKCPDSTQVAKNRCHAVTGHGDGRIAAVYAWRKIRTQEGAGQ